MRTNWLANVFDWLGDALERFNPSAFRFLAAALPYLTPVPVAWLTAHSSSQFLHFTPAVAFVFVFALEGIGLWFTTMLVDAVVDWVRSRNWKSFVPVALFAGTVYAYVSLLVSLNVTLETASGADSPVLSKVVTLMCFLPLITGVGNGYYKLKLEHKTEVDNARTHQDEMELLKLREANSLKLEKYRIKYGTSGSRNGNSKTLPEVTSRTTSISETTSGSGSKMGRPSVHQERVFSYLEQAVSQTGEVPTFTEVMQQLGLPQSTASRLRNEWLETKQ